LKTAKTTIFMVVMQNLGRINASIGQNPVTVQMAAGFLPMNLKLLEIKELFLAVWRK